MVDKYHFGDGHTINDPDMTRVFNGVKKGAIYVDFERFHCRTTNNYYFIC